MQLAAREEAAASQLIKWRHEAALEATRVGASAQEALQEERQALAAARTALAMEVGWHYKHALELRTIVQSAGPRGVLIAPGQLVQFCLDHLKIGFMVVAAPVDQSLQEPAMATRAVQTRVASCTEKCNGASAV